MERFNVPIPPDDDFPQVIRAQRNGEDMRTEYLEYVPRWKIDSRRQAVLVDKDFFFGLKHAFCISNTQMLSMGKLVQDMLLFDVDARRDEFIRRAKALGIEVPS